MAVTDNEGDKNNAHYLPKFADRIIEDAKLLPLWSCVSQQKFGFGKIPASSASVEGDFNIIKIIMLKTEKTPMRADEFGSKHENFMSGRLKIAHAHVENNIAKENTTQSDEEIDDSCKTAAEDTDKLEEQCPAPSKWARTDRWPYMLRMHQICERS